MALGKLQVILLLALLPLLGRAEVYQWYDEQGRVQFGDRPPGEVETHTIEFEPSRDRERLRIIEQHTGFDLSEQGARRMQQGIRHIFDIYTRHFGLDIHDTVEVNLHLFASHGSYNRWVEERIGRTIRSTGIFLTQSNEVAVWQWGTEDQVISTLLHEASHVMLYQLAPGTPVWLQEGLAQYLQTVTPQNDRLRIDPIPEALMRIRGWLDDGSLISVRRYLSIPEQEWVNMAHNRDAVPYTVAWGLVYFLMSRPVGEQTLRRLLHDLEKTGLRPTLDIINDRYPGGITNLEYDFFRWAQEDVTSHRY